MSEKNNYQDLSKFSVEEGFRGRSAWIVQLWWIVQSLLIHPSPQFMYGWRRFLWKLFGAQVGEGVLIRPSARVTYPWKVSVGDHSWIGDRADLYSLGAISIGRHVVISQDSYLCAASHDYSQIDFPLFEQEICVEDQVWIAAGAFVAPGVSIGKGAIVGSRSVVLSNVTEAEIVAGNPAKAIGKREAI